jgi:hypothetical protein
MISLYPRWRSLETNLVDACLIRGRQYMTRGVRRAFVLGDGNHNRQEWLENRLEQFTEIFAVAVGRFSVWVTYSQSRPA